MYPFLHIESSKNIINGKLHAVVGDLATMNLYKIKRIKSFKLIKIEQLI